MSYKREEAGKEKVDNSNCLMDLKWLMYFVDFKHIGSTLSISIPINVSIFIGVESYVELCSLSSAEGS